MTRHEAKKSEAKWRQEAGYQISSQGRAGLGKGGLQKIFSALRAGGPVGLAWLGLLQKNFSALRAGGARWLGLAWLTSKLFLRAAREGGVGLAWLTSKKNFRAARGGAVGLA